MAATLTTEGMNHILDVELHGTTQVATWYVGLVDNAGFSAYAEADTAAQIGGTNGWAELSEYDEANRVAYVEAAASSASTTNSANKAAFTMNATKTVRGAFLVSTNTKDGTTGVLLGEGDFSAAKSVTSGDTLSVTVTVSLADNS